MTDIFLDPAFWVAASTLMFFSLLGRKLYKQADAALESREKRVVEALDQVLALKKETEQELIDAQKKLQSVEDMLEEWWNDLRRDVQHLEKHAEQNMEAREKRVNQDIDMRVLTDQERMQKEVTQALLDALSEKMKVEPHFQSVLFQDLGKISQ